MKKQKDYKQMTIDALKKAGANIENLRIKYFKKSPYQKNRYKPEFVFPEIWVSLKEKTKSKYSILINFEFFESGNSEEQIKEYFDAYIYAIKAFSNL